MNCVYMYENIDKSEGARFYIGSKQECTLADVDGIPTIIDNKSGLPYYGSSSNPLMSDDMSRGDRFSASILERSGFKTEIRSIEQTFLETVDAASSGDYYNLTNNTLQCNRNNKIAPYNFLGETVDNICKNRSSVSKRDSTAEVNGFSNFAEMYYYYWGKVSSGEMTSGQAAKEVGKERHYFQRLFKRNNIDKSLIELQEINMGEVREEVRRLIQRGVSLQKIAEYLSLELTTIRYVAGGFYQSKSRKKQRGVLNTALVNGLTDDELLDSVSVLCLRGYSIEEIAKEFNISSRSVSRHIIRSLRKSCTEDQFKNSTV